MMEFRMGVFIFFQGIVCVAKTKRKMHTRPDTDSKGNKEMSDKA